MKIRGTKIKVEPLPNALINLVVILQFPLLRMMTKYGNPMLCVVGETRSSPNVEIVMKPNRIANLGIAVGPLLGAFLATYGLQYIFLVCSAVRSVAEPRNRPVSMNEIP